MQNLTEFDYHGIHFDQRHGMGAIPHVEDIGYRGFVAFMSPSVFLNLAPKQGVRPDASVIKAVKDGKALSMGYLIVDVSGDLPAIVGHEGRHRMTALAEMHGADTPFPVAFLFQGGVRARDIDMTVVERLNEAMRSEETRCEPSCVVRGPLFEEVILSGERFSVTAPAPAPF